MISFIWFMNVCDLPVHIHEDAIIADSCHLALLCCCCCCCVDVDREKRGSKAEGKNKKNNK